MTEDDAIALRYQANPIARMAFQAIPLVGGPLDTLLAWRGTHLQQQRINHLLEELHLSFTALDSSVVQYSDFNSEEGADLLMTVLRVAARHRSKRRIKALADVVVRRAQGFEGWNEAEEAVKLIDDLQELDLLILSQMHNFRMLTGVFENTITFQVGDIIIEPKKDIEEPDETPKLLTQVFSDIDARRLRLAVMRLIGLGLAVDEGLNRYNTKRGRYFSFTETATWLLAWLREEETL